MPPTQAWKDFERKLAKLFGGRRVPLSGSNSGHDTRADVMFPDKRGPGWLYLEAKRRQVYTDRFMPVYDDFTEGKCWLWKIADKVYLCFSLEFLAAQCNESLVYIAERMVKVPTFDQIQSITREYLDNVAKASNEGKTATLLCIRLHNKPKILCIANAESFMQVKKWALENAEFRSKIKREKEGKYGVIDSVEFRSDVRIPNRDLPRGVKYLKERKLYFFERKVGLDPFANKWNRGKIITVAYAYSVENLKRWMVEHGFPLLPRRKAVKTWEEYDRLYAKPAKRARQYEWCKNNLPNFKPKPK